MLNRVPYEIFSKIIKLSNRRYLLSNSSFGDETSLPPIVATRVCRSWRKALLRDPTMWTSILLKYTEIDFDELVKILSWSGSLPLDVFIEKGDNHPRSHHFVNLICKLPRLLQEMDRIRTFRVLLPANVAGAILCLFTHPAPVLQKFYFEVDEETQSESEWVSLHEAFTVNRTLFFEKVPNLGVLHLPISSGFGGLQFISFWRNLSRIHFQFISNIPISGDGLLNILQLSSPSLRALCLTWSDVVPNIVFSDSSHRIFLPYLRELSLQGTCEVEYIDFLLERLDFPVEKVNFDITCVDSYHTLYSSTSLMHFISQRRLSLLSIYESSTSEMGINFSEQTSDLNLESPVPNLYFSGNPVLRTLFDYRDSLDGPSTLFRERRMSNTVTHMCLEDYHLEATMLRDVLLLLPNLQYFRVYHGSTYKSYSSLPKSYLRALLPPRKRVWRPKSDRQKKMTSKNSEINNDPSQAHLLPCPSLHTLQLVFHGEYFEFNGSYLQVLLQCFQFREETGHPLKSIIIWYESLCMPAFFYDWLEEEDHKQLGSVVEFRLLSGVSNH